MTFSLDTLCITNLLPHPFQLCHTWGQYSTLIMEVIYSPETMITAYKTARCHNLNIILISM